MLGNESEDFSFTADKQSSAVWLLLEPTLTTAGRGAARGLPISLASDRRVREQGRITAECAADASEADSAEDRHGAGLHRKPQPLPGALQEVQGHDQHHQRV